VRRVHATNTPYVLKAKTGRLKRFELPVAMSSALLRAFGNVRAFSLQGPGRPCVWRALSNSVALQNNENSSSDGNSKENASEIVDPGKDDHMRIAIAIPVPKPVIPGVNVTFPKPCTYLVSAAMMTCTMIM
jgi:hypothetical protein